MSSLTVSQRILIHLSLFSRLREEYECPKEVTQKGVSSALGLSRSHVALELKKLMEEGHVESRLAHVKGAKTRRKVYFPTFSGERMAVTLRRRARDTEARWIEPEGRVREGMGADLLRLCRSLEVPLTPIYEGILRGDVVDLRVETPEEATAEGVQLVGRRREMDALRDWYGEGPPVMILTGLPGIGKTTLARAFLQSVEGGLWVQVYPFHSAPSLLSAIARRLESRGRPRLLAYLKGSPLDYAEAGLLLSSEASDLLLVFDDVSASPASQVLRLFLEYPPPGCKVLLTARERPDFVGAEERMEGRVTELRLDGLSAEESGELLRAFGGSREDPGALHSLTGGHPLLLRLLASSGPGVEDVEAFLLEEALRGLGTEEESLLVHASVYRRPFPGEALPSAGFRALPSLVRRGLLTDNGGEYEVHDFLRPLIKRLAGQGVKEGHLRAAAFWRGRREWVEALYHLAAAGRGGEVLLLAREVMDEVLERGQAAELVEVLEGADGDPGAELLYLKGRALDYVGRWREALAAIEEALRRAPRGRRLPLLILRGRVLSKMGEFRGAEEAFEAAAGTAEEEGQRLDLGTALYGLGIVQRKMGDMATALDYMRRALEIFEEEGVERETGRARMEMGILQLQAGRSEEAVEWFQRSMPLLSARREDSAYLYNNLGIAYSKLSRQEQALEAFEESVRRAEAAGMVRAQAYAMSNASDLYVEMGDLDRAVEYCERSLRIFDRLQEAVMISACHANRAKVERARGKLKEAERLYLRSLEVLEDGPPYSLAARWLEVSDLYEEMGHLSKAHEYRSRALQLLQEEGRAPPSREP